MSSGADRHLDIGLQVVEGHPLFPYFLEKCLAIPTSPFFIYSNNYHNNQLLQTGFLRVILKRTQHDFYHCISIFLRLSFLVIAFLSGLK